MDYTTVLLLTLGATFVACGRQKRDTPQCKDCEQYCSCLPDVKMSPDVRKKHDALAECTEVAVKKVHSQSESTDEAGKATDEADTKYEECMKKAGYELKGGSGSGRICPDCKKPVLTQLMGSRKKRSASGAGPETAEEEEDPHNRELIACLAKKGMSSPDGEDWNKFYDEQGRLFNEEYDNKDNLCHEKHCLNVARSAASEKCKKESEAMAESASGAGPGHPEKE